MRPPVSRDHSRRSRDADANEGIDFITAFLQPFADTVGMTYGDAIQFGAAVGLSLCPGAPKIPAFVGRPNATQAAPDKTVCTFSPHVHPSHARAPGPGARRPVRVLPCLSAHAQRLPRSPASAYFHVAATDETETDAAIAIFARMADAGFTPTELVHLLASHRYTLPHAVSCTAQQTY